MIFGVIFTSMNLQKSLPLFLNLLIWAAPQVLDSLFTCTHSPWVPTDFKTPQENLSWKKTVLSSFEKQ